MHKINLITEAVNKSSGVVCTFQKFLTFMLLQHVLKNMNLQRGQILWLNNRFYRPDKQVDKHQNELLSRCRSVLSPTDPSLDVLY